jgi:hypothetical protein
LGSLDLANPEQAKTWLLAFNAMARAKKWNDEEDGDRFITDNFMATCGLQALGKVQYIVSPRNMEEMAFKDIQLAIETYLRPKARLVIAERTRFYSNKQHAGEAVCDFVPRLRKEAAYCEFDKLKASADPTEEMIKVALVAGLHCSVTKQKVLEKMQASTTELSVAQIQEFVQQFEMVQGFVQLPSTMHSPSAEIHYNKVTGANSTIQQIPGCRFCGKHHAVRRCPAFGKKCTKCSKLNHFAIVCRSTESRKNIHMAASTDIGLYPEEMSADDVCHVAAEGCSVHSVQSSLVDVRINSSMIKMQRDTGADVSLISSKLWQVLDKPNLTTSTKRLEAYDGHTMRSLGKFNALLEYDDKFHVLELVVVDAEKDFGLLGRDAIPKLGTYIHQVGQSDTENIYLPTIKNIKASMQLIGDVPPTFCRARTVPLAMQEKVAAELDRLERMGVISKQTEGVANASPIVWVRKPDGKLRMCVDYKVHVNKKIKTDAYPIPKIETIFSKMKNANTFAKLDLTSAYWQIELDEAAKELAYINTSQGIYSINRLQMGMKNASAIFQRVMEQILADIKGIIIYQDDILVFAENEAALNKRLIAVKTRLNEKRITINWKKSTELASEISFLGFHVSSRGVEPDQALVNRIKDMKPPTNKREVESFVGLVNYFGRLVPQFSSKLAPINMLRKRDAPFIWSEKCVTAFDNLKKELTSSPVVQPYSLNKEATVTTDASQEALAAVLTQEGHPVIFISRNLSGAERKYSNIEREALAITWAVTRLKHFLLGRRFDIVTDHQPLIHLFGSTKPIPESTSARITKWALLLMNYDYEVKYARGRDIPHVDALTRLQFTHEGPNVDEERANTTLTVNAVYFSTPLLQVSTIRNEIKRDTMLQRILWRVIGGDWSDCSQAEKPFKATADKLTIDNGVLYYRSRLFIPKKLRPAAFSVCHNDVHSGIHSTYRRMQTSSWWPNMFNDVMTLVNSCSVCIQNRPTASVTKTINHWPPALPFQRIHIDWAYTKEVGEVLVIVDSGSGWIEAFKCNDRSSQSVIKCLEAVFSRFGPAETVVSDNAKEFVSGDLNQWIEAQGAIKMESPPYFPQSNGCAERAVQTVKRFMKCWSSSQNHQEFSSFLRKALFHHRVSSNARGISPAEIVFGRKVRTPIVSNYQQGQEIFYRSTGASPTTDAEFLMTKGSNTSWIIGQHGGEDKVILASNNQISPMQTPIKPAAIEATSENTSAITPVVDGGGEEAPQLRRSCRERRRPDFYGQAPA